MERNRKKDIAIGFTISRLSVTLVSGFRKVAEMKSTFRGKNGENIMRIISRSLSAVSLAARGRQDIIIFNIG